MGYFSHLIYWCLLLSLQWLFLLCFPYLCLPPSHAMKKKISLGIIFVFENLYVFIIVLLECLEYEKQQLGFTPEFQVCVF